LVFPIFEDNNIADMKVPDGTWIYYFNHTYILNKKVQALAFPLEEFPIFIKKGSIYPIERGYLNLPYMNQYKLQNS
jgi:alpha-glucosidase (family GH31 glycosyl hydrolase)